MWNAKVIAQSRGWFRSLPVTSYHNQPEEMADCWCGPMQRKLKYLMMIKYIAIEFVQAWQIGRKVNTILET